MSIAALVMLGPVHFGQWLSLLHYRTRSKAWDRISDDLSIGRVLTKRETKRLKSKGVSAVIDLTAEFSEVKALRGEDLPYMNLQVLDLTAATPEQIAQALAFIDEHTQRGPVFMHCKAGYSRSAAVAGAHLLHTGRAKDADGAAAMLRERRPGIVIRPEAMAAIREFALSRR